ncbi:DNA polymerase III subunit gamma and tau [Nonomuraea sp. NPDC048881]|uniref:DNA polymerase III subunit gamma and tau n=1 Tax=Nonomuraea sp. NPDC048881 TaxID=3155030 RepID=UPI00340165D6
MSLALYRKYRPGTFAEVKGQEHVTDPLRQALRTGRINHAYLFSGPRGCGKTSSARILARSLNCEQGPTPDPCGACESCVALAPTGPGHLDVIEIDAASHGGVDDARDLRERAFFAPVSARYKIYIIDEAHMVTREGFNALLKLVEEPPPHLKFIFATTEPEKVIGTIKSRTHHYPFRLMPPATLKALMEEILTSESVPFEPPALPLVVRAGAGSARDSLSILDQLLAGAEDDGITYAKAVSLLGYTDGDLLDEVVNAFAARDGGQVFQAVNRVIEGGHDPRRFASDLLERFRDLVILANVPEAASSGLLDRPADELERLVGQASSMGPAELTRAAEIFNAGLTEMRGATSPRLLLELMCARVLLPGASQGEASLLARLERLERGGTVAQMASRAGAVTIPRPAAPGGGHDVHVPVAPPAVSVGTTAPVGGDAAVPEPATPAGSNGSAGGQGPVGGGADDWPEPVRPGSAAAPVSDAPAPVAQAPVAQAPAAAGPVAGGAGGMQQQWPAVLAALKQRSIVVWANVSTNAQVVGVEGNLVTLGFSQVGAMKNFTGGGKDAVVATALGDVLGGTWRVEAVVGGSPAPQATRGPARQQPPSGGHGAPAPQAAPAASQATTSPQGGTGVQATSQGRSGSHGGSQDDQGSQDPGQPPATASARPTTESARPTTDESWPDAPDDLSPGSPPSPDPTQTVTARQPAAAPVGAGLAAARSAAKAAAQAGPRTPASRAGGTAAWPSAIPGRDKAADADDVDPLNDADADVDAVSGMALLQRELGAQVIGEIDHT